MRVQFSKKLSRVLALPVNGDRHSLKRSHLTSVGQQNVKGF